MVGFVKYSKPLPSWRQIVNKKAKGWIITKLG